MGKEGFLTMEPGVQRSGLRATENAGERTELVIFKEHFLLPEQGALVTCLAEFHYYQPSLPPGTGWEYQSVSIPVSPL